MISTKGRYALRIMADIAAYSDGNVVALKDVSARQAISMKYSEQVVSLLVRSGMLISVRGNGGGYMLAKRPSEYTAGEILSVAEGTLAPIACLREKTQRCPHLGRCSTVEFWQGYYDVIKQYTDGVTLEDLANKEREKIGNDYNI